MDRTSNPADLQLAEPADATPTERRRWRSRVLESAAMRYAREAREDDLGTHLLAISAQQLLCTAPLAVTLGALSKRLTGVSLSEVLAHVLSLSERAEGEVSAALAGSPKVGLGALVLNLLLAVGFAAAVAATLQRGLELIWHLPRATIVRSTIRQTTWAIALPLLICMIVLVGRESHLASQHMTGVVVAGFLVQFVLIGGFIWWTQRMLLASRVAWRQLLAATALSTAAILVVLLVGRQLISGQIVPAYRAYGAAGIVIVLSAWVAIMSTAATGGLAVGCWVCRREIEYRRRRSVGTSAEQVPA